jgi:ribosomal subunit interface protein
MRPDRNLSVATPVQITVRHMGPSEALTERIRASADKLSEFYPRIANCHVVIEQEDRHRAQGRSYRASVVLRVPGEQISVTRDHDEDLYAAVRDAFASATRQLEEYARRERGDGKAHSTARRVSEPFEE